jgi:hypothetical protein
MSAGGVRITGVDVARGVALLGMMAVHSFDVLDETGAPTTATVVAAGRSAAAFVVIAGISLAFMSGGRRAVQGRERTVVSAGLVVRALLIGVIGLALGELADLHGVDGILPFYAVLFPLAVALLGWPPRVLAGVAAAVIVAGPVLLIATAGTPLATRGSDVEPSFSTLVDDPLGVFVQLFVTGEYAVVVYLAYICAGLAVGRLDLESRRVAWWLFGGGVALAVVARLVSVLLLSRIGGVDPSLLWQLDSPIWSWWSLALPTPHSHTPIDLVHTLGSAIAVVGAALLVTRVRVVARVLSPVAAAGTMVLTLYSAHLLFLATGLLGDSSVALYLAMAVGGLAFAAAWRRWIGQGPLERVIAAAAGAARRRVAARSSTAATGLPQVASASGREQGRPAPPPRLRPPAVVRAAQFCATPALAVALVVVYWAGTPSPAPASSLSAEGADPAPPVVVVPELATQPGRVGQPAAVPDVGRYCQLSDQLGDVEDRYPDDPKALVDAAGVQLVDMPRVAPLQIRDAVTLSVEHLRADAGEPTPNPDEAAVEQAEDTIDAFEDEHCP